MKPRAEKKDWSYCLSLKGGMSVICNQKPRWVEHEASDCLMMTGRPALRAGQAGPPGVNAPSSLVADRR